MGWSGTYGGDDVTAESECYEWTGDKTFVGAGTDYVIKGDCVSGAGGRLAPCFFAGDVHSGDDYTLLGKKCAMSKISPYTGRDNICRPDTTGERRRLGARTPRA